MSRRRLILLASFCVVLVLNLFGFIRELSQLLPVPKPVDFPDYYVAASILNNGQAEHLYDVQFQKAVANQEQIDTFGGNYIYLPAFALLFRPLAQIPFPLAAEVWVIVNLILLYSSVRILLGLAKLEVSEWQILVVFFVVLILPPVAATVVVLGQINILMLFLLALAIRLIDIPSPRQDAELVGGYLLGLAAAIKLFPILLLIPLALRRRWSSIAAACAGVVSVILVGIVGAGGLGITFKYLAVIFAQIAGSNTPGDQSLFAALQRMLTKTDLTFWWLSEENSKSINAQPLIDAPGLIAPVFVIAALVIAAMTFKSLNAAARQKLPIGFDLAVVLAASLTVMPHVWDHWLVLLLIPWAYMVRLWPGWRTSSIIVLTMALLTVQRYWRPLAFFGFPVPLLNFGYLAAFATWLYAVYCAFVATPYSESSNELEWQFQASELSSVLED